jgi:hypothetical protein
MKNLNLQQVTVYVNRVHGFAHIAINNQFTKDGKVNYSKTTLPQLYHSAKYAAGSETAEHHFNSSFLVRLMNTGVDDWEEVERITDLSLSDALRLVKDLYGNYNSMGFDVTGAVKGKGIRQTGEKAIPNYIIREATIEKINKIVETLAAGIPHLNLKKVQKEIYFKWLRDELQTRRQFWVYIQENLGRLA